MNRYLSNISTKVIDNKIYYNLNDINRLYVSDIDCVREKLLFNNIDLDRYVDLYTLLLIMCFSCDKRTNVFKMYFIYNTFSQINDIINPKKALDRCKTILCLKNEEEYSYNNYNKKDILDIIELEINNSLNVDIIRQII